MVDPPAHLPELQIDLRRYELTFRERPVRLEKLPFELLILLAEHQGELVSRNEIQKRLWGDDVFVETDKNINVAIRKIRQALGDDPDVPRLVQTLVGRGYRLIAPVHIIPKEGISDGSPTARATGIAPRSAFLSGNAARLWLAVIAITAVLLIMAGMWRERAARARAVEGIHTLAVLPLENLSGDASQEYFADGMTDELITEVAKLGDLQVISRSSAMRFKKGARSIPEIGRQLSADAVLEGSVVRAGDRVRITVQLIRAPTDHHLWAESYERDLKDVLFLQRDIATDVGRQIHARFGARQPGLTSQARQIDPAAYEAFLKGLFYLNKLTPESAKQGLDYLNQAVRTSPFYPEAHANLAHCYSLLGGWLAVLPREEALAEANAEVREALQQDETLPMAHAMLASLKEQYDWDWATAEREFRRAIELNPSYADAHGSYARFLVLTGRVDEAPTEVERARSLDPLAFGDVALGAWILEYSGHHQQARERMQTVLEMEPNSAHLHFMHGLVCMDGGELEEAAREFRTAIRMYPSFGKYKAHLAFVLARSGRRDEARRILDELLREHNVVSFDVGLICAGLGENDIAIDWIEKAYQERSIELIHLRVLATPNTYERPFYSLRFKPRFQSLLRKMNFAALGQ